MDKKDAAEHPSIEPIPRPTLEGMTIEQKLDYILLTMWTIEDAVKEFGAKVANTPMGKMFGIK